MPLLVFLPTSKSLFVGHKANVLVGVFSRTR